MEQRYSDNEPSRRDIPSFIEPRPPLIQNPFMRPRPQKGTNLLEQFEEDSEIEEPELVQVYLRMKPCNVPSNLYEVRSDKSLVTSMDTTTAGHGRRTQHNVSRMYTFSRIFTSDCSQKEIFEQVVKDNLKKLPDGHSFTLLTYGASGSGKTYTLMGTVTSPGLVPRALEYVFKLVDAAQMPTYKPSDNGADELGFAQQDSELTWVKRLRHVSAPLRDKYRRMSAQLRNDLTVSNIDLTNRTKYYVWVSFVEIYNEAVYDLLAPPEKRVKMRIREDTAGNVYVKGVTQAFVRSGEEAYDVMVAGKHNLIVAATGIHAQSSRSHCIFTITMLTENDGVLRTSHVRLCDLAGCERQRAARNTGARMQESRAINSSLHVLERCLHMLRRKQRLARDASMVPYRESKLTRLLGSGLSGARGEAVSMVVTLNPAPQYAHETRHVLSLAAVAQDIQINNTLYASTLSTLESSTQDTTICSNAEVMKLRSDNERLHFELIQSQARNKELLASMEEKQQQTASTMQELVEETKDMMSQYYEAQIQALKTEMEDMIEEYESRLAKPAAPAVLNVGTPTRFLQSKVAQLMTEITVLEDKLSEEILARSRAEKEVQHLRNCIEERDEKAFKENSTENENQIVLTDSDHESDDDTSDPFNESLEPVLKKERDGNRSHIIHTPKHIEKCEVVETMDKTIKEKVGNDEFDNEGDKSNDTLKCDNSIISPRDSMYATGDDESELEEESKQVESTHNSMANFTETINDINDKKTSYEVEETDNSVMTDTIADNDKSECEEFFRLSTKVHDETEFEQKKHLKETNIRGTYYVSYDESQNEFTKEDIKEKNLSAMRGTYFIQEQAPTDKKLDVEDDTVKDKQSVNEIIRPKKVSETLVSKIIKSLKISQSSDSSLRQFEQLEMAANNVDNSKDKSTDFVDIKILKDKKTYFNNTANELSNKQDVIEELPDETRQCDDRMFDILSTVKKQEKSVYLKDKTDAEICNFSSASKLQQLHSVDDYISDATTSSKKPEKTSYFEGINDKSKISSLSSAAKVQAKLLYFDDNDKTCSDDVLISRSGIKPREMRTYFDNIDVNVASAFNKNVNDIIVHSLKDQERSPSIVKDETSKDYEPSNAIKNLLRESFTKPDFSSIHKSRVFVKKHDSVDIFESPSINIAIDKEATSKIEVKTNTNSEKTKENNFEEAKELSNVEVIRKSIERLVLEQKIKADVKQEVKLEHSSSIEKFVTDNGLETNPESKEVEKDNIDVTVSSEKTLNDTQSLKENKTDDEFENIWKDLSSVTVRTTEFELLVPQDVNASNLNDQEASGTFKAQEKHEEVSERTTFEETKYNLRHKGDVSKSHSNCESKAKTTTKRSLRLRRRKNQDDENSDQDNESKLKDIINLKQEFSDVTMGVPAVKREVMDIPSPEKLPGEENLPPMMGIQSCPMKSVTRSRRKLFTPRAEPLEESMSQVGDSNERIYVPRPSYHRTRARRKL